MKTIEKYALEHDITYINYDKLSNEIKLDYNIDFADSKHLNIIGAAKTTSHMGDYLVTHYDVPDHRREYEYDNWNKDYVVYERFISKKRKEMLNKLE